jgi:hypothetical protein
MPIARFQLEDGRVARFEVPEGTSPEQAQSMMMEHFAPTQATPEIKPLSKMDKVLKGVIDPIEGGAQLLTEMLPKSVVNAGDAAQNWIAEKTGLMNKLPRGGSPELFKQNEAEYQARRGGDTGMDWARIAGNVVSPANLALAAKLPMAAKGAGMAAKTAIGALGGGLSALTAPVTEGEFWNEKAKQVGTGALFGGATPAVMNGVSRVINPNASNNEKLALLLKEGVKPTIGQTLGGWANRAEEAATSLPFIGDAIGAARNRAKEQFNQAAVNRATAPIGAKVEGMGTQAVNEASNLIGDALNKAEKALVGFSIDKQAKTELDSLKALASSGLEGRERNTVKKYFSDYLSKPALTAETYTELNSKLGADIARFKAGDAYQQKVGDALAEVKDILSNNAMRANPSAAEDLHKAREAYANLVRLEGASKGAKSTDGVFTPGQLLTAVQGADRSVRDRATSHGTALMQDLASAGQSVLGNKLPNSGTADRMIYGGGILGLGAGGMASLPATAALVGSGVAAYTPLGQSLLRGAVSVRPENAQAIAQALRNRSIMFAPAAGAAGAEFLK